MKNFLKILILCVSLHNLNAQIARIPFELVDDLMYVKVKINDNTEENVFVFDTGATADLLDSSIAKELGLKPNYKQNTTGAGGTKSYDVILSQKLSLNNSISVDNTHLVLSDLSRIIRRSGKKFDGIIGYSLLKDHVTKIDYDSEEILVYNKIQDLTTDGYESISFEFGNGIPIPQFDINITLRNSETFKGKVFFDSGAGLTMLMNSPFAESNEISNKVKKRLISKSENLHGESTSEKIAIKSMNIGGYQLSEMPINIAHDKNGVSSYKDYLGILGGAVISKFNVILDYNTSTLYLKPNKNFTKPFDFPMSGISLIKTEDGKIIIDRVEKTSTAFKNGIRKGDQLLSVNNDSSGNIQNYRTYLKQEDSSVNLVYSNSKGKQKTTIIKLERLL